MVRLFETVFEDSRYTRRRAGSGPNIRKANGKHASAIAGIKSRLFREPPGKQYVVHIQQHVNSADVKLSIVELLSMGDL